MAGVRGLLGSSSACTLHVHAQAAATAVHAVQPPACGAANLLALHTQSAPLKLWLLGPYPPTPHLRESGTGRNSRSVGNAIGPSVASYFHVFLER